METIFETGVETLRQKLMLMAGRAAASVNHSVQSLLQRDLDLAVQVRQADDGIDKCEVEIDALALQLLTQAPLATDLRSVTVAMKIAQNLERGRRRGGQDRQTGPRPRARTAGASAHRPATTRRPRPRDAQ
jgi:phosphate transport system protein